MHSTPSYRQPLFHLLAILVLILGVLPLIAGAQGLVPCGFDTNADEQVSGDEECDFEDLMVLIGGVLNYLIYFVATPIAAIMFAIAGFFYLTAGDDMGKVKRAHDIFISVLWGFGIMLIAWALVSFIINFFTDGTTYNLLEAPET